MSLCRLVLDLKKIYDSDFINTVTASNGGTFSSYFLNTKPYARTMYIDV